MVSEHLRPEDALRVDSLALLADGEPLGEAAVGESFDASLVEEIQTGNAGWSLTVAAPTAMPAYLGVVAVDGNGLTGVNCFGVGS